MAQGKLTYIRSQYESGSSDDDMPELEDITDEEPELAVLTIRFTPDMTESIACGMVRSRGLIGPPPTHMLPRRIVDLTKFYEYH